MNKALRWTLWTLVGFLSFGGAAVAATAHADVDCGPGECANLQEGDNGSRAAQAGTSGSGDAVAGQVTGVVSSGETSVDATNRSEDVDVSTGDTTAANGADNLTGQRAAEEALDSGLAADVSALGAVNAQEGDNSTEVAQAAEASSGDGVAGQVIGVVTSAGGSADVVAANTSEDVDTETGATLSGNFINTFTGQDSLFVGEALPADAADVVVGLGDNVQEGDNDFDADQSAISASGDGVGGQVIGVVSAGDTSVDATNASEDIDVSTGDAASSNESGTFTGQDTFEQEDTGLADASDAFAAVGENLQEGDNSAEVGQGAEASSGDGVGGSVIGVVTSAGGSSDVVAANTSSDVDIETGEGAAENLQFSFVGQESSSVITDDGILVDVLGLLGDNAQDGDNDLSADQSATSASGDGVGGQVIGVVSAGDTSVDATNASEDIDVSTGDAAAINEFGTSRGGALTFTGQSFNSFTVVAEGLALDVSGVDAANAQNGDNATDAGQAAEASSGDGVGGQVIGVVTSAGGTADVVAASTSEDVGVQTGDADAGNLNFAFTGQEASIVEELAGADLDIDTAMNAQEGDNDGEFDQEAVAATGDGVGGQVIGIVSAGDTSVDATNSSEDMDLETGDASADNELFVFAGQLAEISGAVFPGLVDLSVGESINAQDGDNSQDLVQNANGTSGDAVGGQVAGVVTSAGGSADLVLANTSQDVDATTGQSESFNFDDDFVGQAVEENGLIGLLDI